MLTGVIDLRGLVASKVRLNAALLRQCSVLATDIPEARFWTTYCVGTGLDPFPADSLYSILVAIRARADNGFVRSRSFLDVDSLPIRR